MLARPSALSILAGFAAFGAIGATMALAGLGLPFLPAAALASAVAGIVQFTALSLGARPATATPLQTDEQSAIAMLEAYRAHTASLRHDLRGVLSPALMMSDRLLGHPDVAVQRAGSAVVRSIDRATALLATSRDLMSPDTRPAPEA